MYEPTHFENDNHIRTSFSLCPVYIASIADAGIPEMYPNVTEQDLDQERGHVREQIRIRKERAAAAKLAL